MVSSIQARSSPSTYLDTLLLRSSFTKSPENVLECIGSYLTLTDVGRLEVTGKSWKRLVSPMWYNTHASKFYLHRKGFIGRILKLLHLDRSTTLNLQIIGKVEWMRCSDFHGLGLNLVDCPYLDRRELIQKVYDIASTTKVEDNKGFTALLIPSGLTLSKLEAIAAPQRINIHDKIRREIVERVIPSSRWIIISNSILEGSRECGVLEQQKLVVSKGGKVPTIIVLTALIVLASKLFRDCVPFSPRLKEKGRMQNTFTRSAEMIFPFLDRFNWYGERAIDDGSDDFSYCDPVPKGAIACTRPIIVGTTDPLVLDILPNQISRKELCDPDLPMIAVYEFNHSEVGIAAYWEVES